MYWSLDVCLVLGGLSLHGSFAQLHSEHPQTSPVILWCLYILYITVYIYETIRLCSARTEFKIKAPTCELNSVS